VNTAPSKRRPSSTINNPEAESTSSEDDQMPSWIEDIEGAREENYRYAWFIVGRLIFSGVLDLPNLADAQSRERLRFAVSEVQFCINNDD